uniref:hypothetical protein n=1 Tax=Helicobacter pylori TaxID=210 RepID=UPI0037BFC025
MNGTTDAAPTPAPKQSFTSGRELINAVKTRREEAQAYWKIAKELQGDMADLDRLDAERVDGVKVLWIAEGVPHGMRDGIPTRVVYGAQAPRSL